MTDVELTRALERGDIANENFHHASHLHVAWVYLAESSSVQEAAIRRGRGQARKISRDHYIVLGAPSLTRVRGQPGRTLGRHRACKSAIARKEFSTRLLFGRAAFQ
jgi:hypothetical protein